MISPVKMPVGLGNALQVQTPAEEMDMFTMPEVRIPAGDDILRTLFSAEPEVDMDRFLRIAETVPCRRIRPRP